MYRPFWTCNTLHAQTWSFLVYSWLVRLSTATYTWIAQQLSYLLCMISFICCNFKSNDTQTMWKVAIFKYEFCYSPVWVSLSNSIIFTSSLSFLHSSFTIFSFTDCSRVKMAKNGPLFIFERRKHLLS